MMMMMMNCPDNLTRHYTAAVVDVDDDHDIDQLTVGNFNGFVQGGTKDSLLKTL